MEIDTPLPSGTPLSDDPSEEIERLVPSAPTAATVSTDAATSRWLKKALATALARDPVKALNDALLLAAILEQHLRDVLAIEADSE